MRGDRDSAAAQAAPTSPAATGDRTAPPPPAAPGASQGQTPTAVSTADPGASTARPELGEAGFSTTTSAGDAVIAASTQPDALPGAPTPAASTRGASARSAALAATLTSGSSQAVDADTGAPSLLASPLATHAPAPAAPAPILAATVGMQDMIDSIRATIELATRQGMTRARIALQPEELGEIRIHLSQTTDGLLARVTADTPAAAQALADARGELHHSLSSLGVSLLRLDIGSPGQSDVGGREGRFPGRFDHSATRSSTRSDDGENGSHTVPGLESAQPPAGPARGELVDVFA